MEQFVKEKEQLKFKLTNEEKKVEKLTNDTNVLKHQIVNHINNNNFVQKKYNDLIAKMSAEEKIRFGVNE